jgi:hypothetical protein
MLELREFVCAECGATFTAKRPTATYCGPTCRKRASKARGGAPVERRETTPVPVVAPIENQPIPDPPLVVAVLAELQEAGKLDTRRGQQAVVMARKLAHAGTTASSAASLSKALDEMMDSLTAPQGLGPSPTTRRGTLAQRRQQKRGAA